MKNLILIIVPILFLACHKDELIRTNLQTDNSAIKYVYNSDDILKELETEINSEHVGIALYPDKNSINFKLVSGREKGYSINEKGYIPKIKCKINSHNETVEESRTFVNANKFDYGYTSLYDFIELLKNSNNINVSITPYQHSDYEKQVNLSEINYYTFFIEGDLLKPNQKEEEKVEKNPLTSSLMTFPCPPRCSSSINGSYLEPVIK